MIQFEQTSNVQPHTGDSNELDQFVEISDHRIGPGAGLHLTYHHFIPTAMFF